MTLTRGPRSRQALQVTKLTCYEWYFNTPQIKLPASLIRLRLHVVRLYAYNSILIHVLLENGDVLDAALVCML